MEGQSFITRPMSLALDSLRAAAALAVLAGHAIRFGLYDGPYPFDAGMPHVAVIVFFVLSGLVIAHSVQCKPVTAGEYAAARIARIFPMTVVAVAFSLVVSLYGGVLGIDYPGEGATPANVVLPLLFLSESAFGSALVWNPPFWSLAYEAMYYALFGVAVFARGRVRWLLLASLLLVAGVKVLLLLPVWLIGVALARNVRHLRVWPVFGLGLIALGGVMVAAASRYSIAGTELLCAWLGQSQQQLGFSEKALTDVFAGLGVAMCFVGLAPLSDRCGVLLERWRRPIRVAADLSFPLYILHWPMLVLLSAYGVEAGSNPLAFAAILALVTAVSATIAALVGRRAPALRVFLTALFARSPLTSARTA